VLLGFNLFCVVAASGYLIGITQSKEYAEPEWYADLWLVIVWVVYFVLYIRTLARRNEPHIYVANWYYLSFIHVVAILHIVNNLAVPASFTGAKSYSAFAGVQDAMVQWWYGHNAVAFFLTTGFLGMLYYFLPKRAGRPIYSYRLSILSFLGIVFFYIWVGSHHLHYTALPQWVQTLGVTFSVMLLVPSWASAGNALMTLNGAWHKVRDDATLRFMMVAAVFYGLSTFEGSFMAIRPVNALSHYTDWTVGHVHSGAMGWVAMITFGSIYALTPVLWRRETMYSWKAVEWHFWLALSGTVIYVFAMWNSGITFMQRSASVSLSDVWICCAEAATFDCSKGTILGRDVVPEVCRISATSSAPGAVVAGAASMSEDNVKWPAGTPSGTDRRMMFMPRLVAAA
jgi:cytochrome c oxidase cbb3-type subunit 1